MQATATPHHWPIRIYYEDTDFGGVVYHANYLRFMERARTEFLRSLGIDQMALFEGELRVAFAVRAMQIEFVKPATMDDLLDVATSVVKLGGASLVLDQVVTREQALLVKARVTIVAVAGWRATRLPQAVRLALETACE